MTMKQKKLGISLKYKLLFLLTAIPVLSLSIYIVLATHLFENDKIAYVKDSSVAVARSLAVQFRMEVNSFIDKIKPIVESYDFNTQKFSDASMALFNKQDRLDGLVIIQKTSSGEYKRLGEMKKENQFSEKFVADKNLIDSVRAETI